MNMQQGKFIVIDGLDGSGKGTQAKILVRKLKQDGYDVELADFPQYGQWSAEFVERYLRGEFGSAQDVGPYRASLFYALDRYAASFMIRDWLCKGKIIISNRYVSANKGHQLGKLHTEEEMRTFLQWLNNLEYNLLGIPQPDLTLFLHMKPEIGQQLVDRKKERSYVKGRDLHEADIQHLRDAERAFLFCAKHDTVEQWKTITCFSDDGPRLIQDIHREIYETVKKIL